VVKFSKSQYNASDRKLAAQRRMDGGFVPHLPMQSDLHEQAWHKSMQSGLHEQAWHKSMQSGLHEQAWHKSINHICMSRPGTSPSRPTDGWMDGSDCMTRPGRNSSIHLCVCLSAPRTRPQCGHRDDEVQDHKFIICLSVCPSVPRTWPQCGRRDDEVQDHAAAELALDDHPLLLRRASQAVQPRFEDGAQRPEQGRRAEGKIDCVRSRRTGEKRDPFVSAAT
jgi:hypothetical protein